MRCAREARADRLPSVYERQRITTWLLPLDERLTRYALVPWTVGDHFCHNGLQLAIGIFVIHCACARCHRLRTVGLKECTVTVLVLCDEPCDEAVMRTSTHAY